MSGVSSVDNFEVATPVISEKFYWYILMIPCIGLWPQFWWILWGGNTCYQWKILLIHFADTPVLGSDLSLDEDFELVTPFISENFSDTFYWYPCIGLWVLWPQFRWRLWVGNTFYQWKILLIHFTDTPVLGFGLM